MRKLSISYHLRRNEAEPWMHIQRTLNFRERLGIYYPRLTTLPIIGKLFRIRIDALYVDSACVGYSIN